MSKKVKLTFSYQPPPGLRGRKDIPKEDLVKYPLIPITLYTENGSMNFEGLVDSGADALHIPLEVAELLGLTKGELIHSDGAGGSYDSHLSKVGLKIGRGNKNRIHDFGSVDVCFPNVKTNTPILLGRNPVFREYNITFEEKNEKIIMKPND